MWHTQPWAVIEDAPLEWVIRERVIANLEAQKNDPARISAQRDYEAKKAAALRGQ